MAAIIIRNPKRKRGMTNELTSLTLRVTILANASGYHDTQSPGSVDRGQCAHDGSAPAIIRNLLRTRRATESQAGAWTDLRSQARCAASAEDTGCAAGAGGEDDPRSRDYLVA